MHLSGDLTPEHIEQATGFAIAIRFAAGPADGAVLASYHDEHERLVAEKGWQNVIGSLCVHEGELVLGIFIRKDNIIEGRLVTNELTSAPIAIEQ